MGASKKLQVVVFPPGKRARILINPRPEDYEGYDHVINPGRMMHLHGVDPAQWKIKGGIIRAKEVVAARPMPKPKLDLFSIVLGAILGGIISWLM